MLLRHHGMLFRISAGFARKAANVWSQHLPKACYSSNITPVKLSFNVFESGDSNRNATPLIIMHGLFGSKQNWRGVSRALEKKLKRKIYAVDARNHGESPHTAEHSSEHTAEDVVELMRQEGIAKAAVMGHSMGGRTMMYLALKYPELVESAIIVDISPISIPRDFSSMDDIFQAMKKISVPSNLSMAEGRIIVQNQIKEAIGHSGTVDFIMLNLRKRETGEFYWAPNIDALQSNLRIFTEFMMHIVDYPPYQGPTMFICGTLSNYVDPDSWPEIKEIFPNAIAHWVNAGHLVHFDEPEKFINYVTDFLKK